MSFFTGVQSGLIMGYELFIVGLNRFSKKTQLGVALQSCVHGCLFEHSIIGDCLRVRDCVPPQQSYIHRVWNGPDVRSE